jgi:hypothetical protein
LENRGDFVRGGVGVVIVMVEDGTHRPAGDEKVLSRS